MDFARRLEKAEATPQVAVNKSTLIDVLAQFPDPTAAAGIALELKDSAQRGKAAQALVKLGPAARATVLTYLDHPDAGVRKEAASLCRLLNIPVDRQLAQTLADVADARKTRSRTALEHLATLRPDAASRPMVSEALNAPLLDPDPAIRDDALAAVYVWATPANTATLLKLLGSLHGERSQSDARTGDAIAQTLISIGPGVEEGVLPLLKSTDALVRRQACWVLTEIGSEKSVTPLQTAGDAYNVLDRAFYEQTQVAIARVMARK
jgi:HEAT repeat protein